DLHGRALSRVDHAYLQPVGVWMFFRRDDPRDGEWGELFGLVLDALDLEPAHGEAIDDRFERRLRFEMLLEPAEGEFHHDADCARRIVCLGSRRLLEFPPPLWGRDREGGTARRTAAASRITCTTPSNSRIT